MTRAILIGAWLVLAVAPLAWWMWGRRKVDVWRAMPVPVAILDAQGTVKATAGPVRDIAFTPTTGLPARGRVVHAQAADGTPLALTGLARGALALALPAEPVRDRRDRVLAELGSRLAHDINTPLSALHGHLDRIAHEPVSDAARDSVRTCQRELNRLQSTAHDLLTLTRLRAGGGTRAMHLAGALAEEAAAGLLDRADELGAALTVEVPAETVKVMVADGDIVRALRNLIGNALSHGLGERREVRVIVDADDSTVTFSVADSGAGIPRDRLAQLCEPLVRGDNPHVTGSGLGLAIVSEVLTAHGARLETHPTGDGGCLSFTLPRA